MSRTFYRIVKPDPPTRSDFLSGRIEGKPRPTEPEYVRLWEGISVYETLLQARKKATALPRIGRFLAEIAIPDDEHIRYERTSTSRGHHTIWSDADVLLQCVRFVHRVHEGAP